MGREKEWALIVEEANTKLHSLLKLSVINEVNKLVVKTEVQNLIGKTEQDLKSKKAPQDLIAKTIKSIKLRFVEWFQRITIILSKHTANPLINKTYQALTGKELKGSNSLLININDTETGGINEVSDFVTTQTHAAGQAYMDDYTKIVKKAMKEIASKNLVMRDKNGRKLSIRNLAEMTARYQDTQDKLQELKNKNINFVVASSHANASKRCQIWQGKVFLLDVEPNTQFKQEVIEGYEPTPLGKIDNINYYSLADAMRHGFLGYNCRHRLIKYTKGMELFREYPVNQIERERNIESKQRNLERQIRRAKQNASMAITKEERQKWNDVSKYYQDKYHDFCHSTGVAEIPWRTRISKDERGLNINYDGDGLTYGEYTNGIESELYIPKISEINSIYKSEEYKSCIKQNVADRDVAQEIIRCSNLIFNHGKAKEVESICIIDKKHLEDTYYNPNGKPQSVKIEPTGDKMLLGGSQYIIIHNHRGNTPPSYSDLKAAYNRKNLLNIDAEYVILTNNGSIYYYKDVDFISERVYNNYVGFESIEQMDEGLTKLAKDHKFIFEKWR